MILVTVCKTQRLLHKPKQKKVSLLIRKNKIKGQIVLEYEIVFVILQGSLHFAAFHDLLRYDLHHLTHIPNL